MSNVASLLLGLGNGGVFAALALALVLTYRSSGVVNFSTGAIALYSAYTYASLRRGQLLLIVPGLPSHIDLGSSMGFFPAAAISLVISAILGAVLYLLVFRPLRNAPPLARAVASLGVLVVIQSTFAIRLGTGAVSVQPIFPFARWQWGSLIVLSDRFYLALSVVVLTVVLMVIYRYSRFGGLTQATAESETGAYVSGVNPDRIALLNWMIGAAVAGAAGILIAPLSPLTPVTYTLFVVPALAAAVVGGFQNLLPTVVAGIAIGMLQAEALSLAARYSWMPRSGSAEMVPLIVILVALLATRRSMPMRGGLLRIPLGRAPRPHRLLIPAVSGFVVGAAVLLLTHGTWRAAVIWSFIAAIIGLSLVVVTGFAGQVSLAQLTLAGCAAFTLTTLTHSWHVPFPLAPILAALVATVFGLVVALPALRLRGLTLGIVTLAFASAVEAVWFRNTQIVSASGNPVTQPHLFGIDLSVGTGAAFPRIGFGIMCLVVLVLVAAAVAWLRRSSLGSAMLAIRANERSASGLGVNVVLVKVAAFAIASFIAGIGGSLLAYRQGLVTYDSYTALSNLNVLSTGYLAGVTSVFGGVLAGVLGSSGILFTALNRWINLGDWFDVLSGLGLIITLITHPEGLASIGHALAARLPLPARVRRRATEADAPVDATEPATRAAAATAGACLLDVEELSVRYGGVVAVDRVSFHVDAGRVVGLIGPNGAGKTSVIDAIGGFAPCDGEIHLDGADIAGLPSHARVRRGMVRTFQSLDLYDDLSVNENLSVSVLAGGRDQRDGAVRRARDLLGISDLGDRIAGELSQGERQLVSMARACAADPLVLLLDEPAAGLDTQESQRLGAQIRAISATGTGVLLVDHDVALVLAVCDHIYVLDYGRVIAEGAPDEIRANRSVAEAYLGIVEDAPVVAG